jgi:hypothetical protein
MTLVHAIAAVSIYRRRVDGIQPSPNGALCNSPGQRPGNQDQPFSRKPQRGALDYEYRGQVPLSRPPRWGLGWRLTAASPGLWPGLFHSGPLGLQSCRLWASNPFGTKNQSPGRWLGLFHSGPLGLQSCHLWASNPFGTKNQRGFLLRATLRPPAGSAGRSDTAAS